jgi:hypothetical protein
MKRVWVLSWVAAAAAWCTMTACGSSNTGTGNASTGGHTTTSSTTHTGGSTGSTTTTSGVNDAFCNGTGDPANVNGCESCVFNLTNTTPCIMQFITQCKADPGCNAYLGCQNACAEHSSNPDAGLQGVGGGGTACVAGENTGDAGSPSMNCIQCCINTNSAGSNTFFNDIFGDCACTTGAPCVSACM